MMMKRKKFQRAHDAETAASFSPNRLNSTRVLMMCLSGKFSPEFFNLEVFNWIADGNVVRNRVRSSSSAMAPISLPKPPNSAPSPSLV